MSNGDHLRASPLVLRLHADAQDYVDRVNRSIAEANDDISRHPLSGGALYTLTADLLGMQRAVLSLCEDGWAFAAVVLLRSMMDMGITAAVITEKVPEAEYRGFKYTHFFLKAELKKAALPPEVLAAHRAQIEAGIRKLPPAQQQRAKDFIYHERVRAYWFCPEFASPTEVLDNLFSPDIRSMYITFSGGSHGGFLGLRILKDQPDSIHPNPRADPRAQNAALIVSTRLLLDIMRMRDWFEIGGRHEPEYRALLDRLVSLRPA
jgi:hypothetical protein